MPFREPALSLRDILDAIDMILQFACDMDLEVFRGDPKTVAAVERKVLLVSEAAMRLGEDAERLCPGVPGWMSKRCGTLSPTIFHRSGPGSYAR